MGFEPVFGFVEATEWFAVEGVFLGGGGEVALRRRTCLIFIWPQAKFYYFLLGFSAASNGNQISRSRCAWGIVG
jgi:hypothetical protein